MYENECIKKTTFQIIFFYILRYSILVVKLTPFSKNMTVLFLKYMVKTERMSILWIIADQSHWNWKKSQCCLNQWRGGGLIFFLSVHFNVSFLSILFSATLMVEAKECKTFHNFSQPLCLSNFPSQPSSWDSHFCRINIIKKKKKSS